MFWDRDCRTQQFEWERGLRREECVKLEDWGRVAQLVEQCPFKAWVAGSSPAALTKIPKHLADFGRVGFGHPRTPRAGKTLVFTPWR